MGTKNGTLRGRYSRTRKELSINSALKEGDFGYLAVEDVPRKQITLQVAAREEPGNFAKGPAPVDGCRCRKGNCASCACVKAGRRCTSHCKCATQRPCRCENREDGA